MKGSSLMSPGNETASQRSLLDQACVNGIRANWDNRDPKLS